VLGPTVVHGREIVPSWEEVKKGAQPITRAAHVATRAQAEAEGSKLVAALYAAFDAFNATYFAGELAAPLVVATFTSPRAFADACERDANGLRSIIRMHPSTLRKGDTFVADVLLHEMIHVWQFEVAKDREDGYRGHGPKFADKCNELGALLGLPPVSPKGRKGLPDCASWPLCVRPSGYYGTPAAEHEREKRSTKKEPKAKSADAAGDELARRPPLAPCMTCGAPGTIELSIAAPSRGESSTAPSCAKHVKIALLRIYNAWELAALDAGVDMEEN
jgi:SprT-like family